MGNVRKKMPKELKGDAMTYRNNITFDLIAVNKAARAEDKSKALEVPYMKTWWLRFFRCPPRTRALSLTDKLSCFSYCCMQSVTGGSRRSCRRCAAPAAAALTTAAVST